MHHLKIASGKQKKSAKKVHFDGERMSSFTSFLLFLMLFGMLNATFIRVTPRVQPRLEFYQVVVFCRDEKGIFIGSDYSSSYAHIPNLADRAMCPKRRYDIYVTKVGRDLEAEFDYDQWKFFVAGEVRRHLLEMCQKIFKKMGIFYLKIFLLEIIQIFQK